MRVEVLRIHQHRLISTIKHKYLPHYVMSFLIITCCLAPGRQLSSYYRQSPSHNLNKASKPFQLRFEVDKNLLIGSVIRIQRVEKFLKIVNSERGIAIELPIEYQSDNPLESPDWFVSETNLNNLLNFALNKNIVTSSSLSLYYRKGSISNRMYKLSM